MSKLTLKEWAARQYHTPPCAKTLRHWVKRGWIQPVPVRVGRPYWVDSTARVVSPHRHLRPDPVLPRAYLSAPPLAVGCVHQEGRSNILPSLHT